MTNPDNKIGDIYDADTVSRYYEVAGKDVESEDKTDADKLLEGLIPSNLEGKTVLDLGSGNARYAEIFIERGANKVIALDSSQSMAEQAKARKDEKNLDRLVVVKGDMEKLPTGTDAVDYIFSRFSLMYTNKLSEVMKQLSHSLKTGGQMTIEVSSFETNDQERSNAMKEPIPLILTASGKEVRIKNFAHSQSDFVDAFNDAGLTIETLEQFPADDLSLPPEYPNADSMKLLYLVIGLKKAPDGE